MGDLLFCVKCNESKRQGEFFKCKKSKTGFQSWCKKCKSEQVCNYYKANPQKAWRPTEPVKRIRNKEYINKFFKDRYQVNVKFVRDYKLKVGCVDCGWKDHHAGLEFDHVTEKKRGTVSGLLGKSMNVIKQEMDRCEVVCSRCHSIRTWERGKNKGDWRLQ